MINLGYFWISIDYSLGFIGSRCQLACQLLGGTSSTLVWHRHRLLLGNLPKFWYQQNDGFGHWLVLTTAKYYLVVDLIVIGHRMVSVVDCNLSISYSRISRILSKHASANIGCHWLTLDTYESVLTIGTGSTLDWHRHQLSLCTEYSRLRKKKSLIFVKVVNVKTNKPGESSKQKLETKNFKSENYQSLK